MSLLGDVGSVLSTAQSVGNVLNAVDSILGIGGASVTPSSQKSAYRPISFVLDDQTTRETPISVTLAIRPEDLTRTDASRLSVQQTLGGAWADNFGAGIPTININGTTGWRRGADGLDGADRFAQLYQQVYSSWHQRRKNAIAAGNDPDLVQLVFADALDNFAVVVAPNSFTLRRSKSRPLLFQYQIAMTVADENVDPLALSSDGASGGFLDADITQAAGLDSFTQSMTDLAGYAASVNGFLGASIAGAVGGFLVMSTGVFSAVMTAVQGGSILAGTLVGIGQLVASAGITAFQILATAAFATMAGLACLMDIAGVFMNVWCLLNNALNLQLYVPDYTALFGSSNCSSTNGGSPVSVFANSNPFYSAIPTPPSSPIQITQVAQQNLATLSNADPVLYPMSMSSLGSTLSSINAGVSVAQ